MAKRNKHRKKNPKWHYSTAGEIPIYVPFLGAVDFLLFFILFLIALYQSAGIPVLIGLGLFCLLGLVLILTVNQKITYTPENFTYRDMLRISHTYSYSQIKKIRCGKDVTIHVGHRIILIDQMAGNGKNSPILQGCTPRMPSFSHRSRQNCSAEMSTIPVNLSFALF